MHLKAIFTRCRNYNIHLNPHKCVFCVQSSQLLGFIVSKEGIRVDPLKVEAILNLLAPFGLTQLQSLQGKEKNLRMFIHNYVELTWGFTQLLKKGIPFFWDKLVHKAFDALNHALTNAPLLHPPDYHEDYFLYLVSFNATISMVLVHEDDSGSEHVIYYLSRSLTKTENKYTHGEKLALTVVQVVQRFCLM